MVSGEEEYIFLIGFITFISGIVGLFDIKTFFYMVTSIGFSLMLIVILRLFSSKKSS